MSEENKLESYQFIVFDVNDYEMLPEMKKKQEKALDDENKTQKYKMI